MDVLQRNGPTWRTFGLLGLVAGVPMDGILNYLSAQVAVASGKRMSRSSQPKRQHHPATHAPNFHPGHGSIHGSETCFLIQCRHAPQHARGRHCYHRRWSSHGFRFQSRDTTVIIQECRDL
ncbi:hypothetical protein FRC03_007830 [Tulasnella sp. 419]|nr:hypothetical protein FRC03_007830 [Tulasnella sp. 419]